MSLQKNGSSKLRSGAEPLYLEISQNLQDEFTPVCSRFQRASGSLPAQVSCPGAEAAFTILATGLMNATTREH